jgi:SulP family sulfate permease
VHRFLHLMRAPRSDVGVMLTTFLLTVLVDLTLAVEVGVVLAALLFVKRMRDFGASVEPVRTLAGDGDGFHGPQVGPHGEAIPEGIQVFELAGPFFFGVADRWRGALSAIDRPPRAVILRMRQVPVIDATGMSALGEVVDKCRRDGTQLYLTGVRPAVLETLRRSKMLDRIGEDHLAPNLATALERARGK